MNDDLVNQRSEHTDYTFDRHPLPKHEPKSKSPVEIDHDKPGKHSKGAGPNSARLSRRSSKASTKEPKAKRLSPESEDRSFHRREQLDHDVNRSHKSTGPKHDDVSDSQENTGPRLDQDAFSSQKSAFQKSVHSSRKSLIDNHNFRESSAKNVAFTPETCAEQPAAAQ